MGMHNSFCPRWPLWFFLSCWIGGLFLGILAAAQAEQSFVSLMRPLFFHRVSIVLLAVLYVLPLLIAAWAVMIQKFEILWFAVFCRCFAYGFLLWLQVRCFGSAAWLVVALSRLSDQLSLAIFCSFALDCSYSAGLCRKMLWICLFITFVLVIVDFFVVSPFFAMLSDY